MRGSYGMLCIALGILAAGLGGYLLNAENKYSNVEKTEDKDVKIYNKREEKGNV